MAAVGGFYGLVAAKHAYSRKQMTEDNFMSQIITQTHQDHKVSILIWGIFAWNCSEQ